jgi:hypothetical protein
LIATGVVVGFFIGVMLVWRAVEKDYVPWTVLPPASKGVYLSRQGHTHCSTFSPNAYDSPSKALGRNE